MSKSRKAAAPRAPNVRDGGKQPHGSYDPTLAPTQAQYTAFARIFDHFNAALFGGTLPPVMLTFSRRARAMGFFAAERWTRQGEKGGDKVGEIALNPDHLRELEAKESAQTLVHEMVHLWQDVYGHPSRRGYHNSEWADQMEAVGLMPSSTGGPNGRRTGQRMSDYVIAAGPFERAFEAMPTEWFLPFISGGTKTGPVGPKPDPSKTKFTCSGCRASAWGKPTLRMMCLECRLEFVKAVTPSEDTRAA
jgi:hypothetical protein